MDGDEARAEARVRRQGDQPGEPAVASAWTKAGSEELEGRGLIGEVGDSRQRGKDASQISSLVTEGENEGRGAGLREPE